MAFCKFCGKELENNTDYCKNCGAKCVDAQNIQTMNQTKSKTKQNILQKRIIFIISAVILIVAGILFIVVIKPFTSPSSSALENYDSQYVSEDHDTSSTSENTVGNTSGNIINGGWATIQGNKIYCTLFPKETMQSDTMDNGAIYVMNADGSNLKKIIDNGGFFLNVVGDRIYFSNTSDGMKLYSAKTDGTDVRKLNDVQSEYIHVIKDKIYYIADESSTLTHGICVMDIDGTSNHVLYEEPALFMNVEDNEIWFVDESGDIKMIANDDVNGWTLSTREYNTTYDIGLIQCVGDDIYYLDTSGGTYGHIYKQAKDYPAELPVKVISDYSDWINISDNTIYYIGKDLTEEKLAGPLYSRKVDGNVSVVLNTETSTFINIVGEWIYSFNISQNEFYLTKKDGSNKRYLHTDGTVTKVSYEEEKKKLIGTRNMVSDLLEEEIKMRNSIAGPIAVSQEEIAESGSGVSDYAVTDTTYSSIDDVKKVVETVLTKSFAEKTLYPQLFDSEHPVYWEQDGVLFRDAFGLGSTTSDIVLSSILSYTYNTIIAEIAINGSKTNIEIVKDNEQWKINGYSENASSDLQLSISQVKEIIKPLIKNGRKIESSIFIGGHLDANENAPAFTITSNGFDYVYYPVTDPDFQSIDDIKSATESVFTKSFAESEFYSRFIDGTETPKYLEKDGVLYEHLIGGVGGGRDWKYDTINILSQTDDTILVEIQADLPAEIETYQLKIKKENGKWFLESDVF